MTIQWQKTEKEPHQNSKYKTDPREKTTHLPHKNKKSNFSMRIHTRYREIWKNKNKGTKKERHIDCVLVTTRDGNISIIPLIGHVVSILSAIKSLDWRLKHIPLVPIEMEIVTPVVLNLNQTPFQINDKKMFSNSWKLFLQENENGVLVFKNRKVFYKTIFR